MVSEIWQTPEQRRQSGVVVRGDKIDNITGVDIDTEFDATGLYHKSLAAHLKLGNGEELDVTGKVMGFIPLRNRREGMTTHVGEGMTEFRCDDHVGYGLSEYLDAHGMKSVNELRGRAIPGFKEWGDLDLRYKLVARIDPKTCIGCQLGQTCQFKNRACHVFPMQLQGAAGAFSGGTSTGESVNSFCIPPTTSDAVNQTAGLPGEGAIIAPHTLTTQFPAVPQ